MSGTKRKAPPKKRPAHVRKCLVLASSRQDLAVVKSILHERGIEPIIPFEIAALGSSIVEHITDSIQNADFVLALIDKTEPSPNLLFELGIAYGLRKQVLIMAPAEARLPSDLSGFNFIRADATNREALVFALDQWLASPRAAVRWQEGLLQKTHPLGKRADALLKRLEVAGSPPYESELLEIVSTALRESGASAVAEHGPRDQGFDIAVWADELGPWVGNPLLIELKARLAPESLLRVRDQLIHVAAKQNRWILLLYHRSNVTDLDIRFRRLPLFLILSIEQFLKELRKRSLGDVIRDLRNRSVHGVE